MNTVLFICHFNEFSGGHLKVRDYFNHVASSSKYVPKVYFSPDTLWNDTNPWLGMKDKALKELDLNVADVIVITSSGWHMFSEEQRRDPKKPVINIIQAFRYADPMGDFYKFNKYKAIRICISPQVFSTMERVTGSGNGLFMVPIGLDYSCFPAPKSFTERSIDVLIGGIKDPKMAGSIEERLRASGKIVRIVSSQIPRKEFLNLIADAKISVFLPKPKEGFFLPPLEGMALGTMVICPAMTGGSDSYRDRVNCFRPANNADDIVTAINEAAGLTEKERQDMLRNAKRTADEHSLSKERDAFLKILDNINQIWQGLGKDTKES